MRTGKLVFIPVFFLLCLAFSIPAYSQPYPEEGNKLIVFYSPSCHKCTEAENTVMPNIEKEFKGRIQIEHRDITDMENYKLLLGLREKYNPKIGNVLPTFFFRGHFLDGKGDIKNGLRILISETLKEEPRGKHGLHYIDLIAYFKTFQPLAVISAGLTDGINPCAFTVIVFFISFLSLQGYRRRELIIIGVTFISAVFMTYLLIGAGLFNFFYRLSGFWVISKIFNLSIGIMSIILGALALFDFFRFKKTAETEGLLLQLPKAIKNRIHSVIGLHYRKGKDEAGKNVRPHILRLAFSALTVGFLVSILEAVCTGQIYLPTITFVLKSTHLKLEALGYLLLYNIMFIVPLFIIFLFALLGTTSEDFSRFLKKYLSAIKILMAAVFFGLGMLLIWRP
jgi:cytochrome c biogenesis protein CcdA